MILLYGDPDAREGAWMYLTNDLNAVHVVFHNAALLKQKAFFTCGAFFNDGT